MVETTKRICDERFEASKTYKPDKADWLESATWEGMIGGMGVEYMPTQMTGMTDEQFDNVTKAQASLPSDFNVHRRLQKVLGDRLTSLETGQGIDWGTAEALAFGSLLQDGVHIRLSGEDVERGTFSHRHAVIHEQKNVDVDNRPQYRPLEHVPGSKAAITICNSSLSEFAVLGFEMGYSLENPQSLVLWEAQFGDFANGAQVIVDQYISSGESKWLRQSGLVMLLPHGYEGARPEHSSCKLERYLQQADDDPDEIMPQELRIQNSNFQICMMTSPANYFHALRRQVDRNFRKPLIVASPKSLLKHRLCVSKRAHFVGDTKFDELIAEDQRADAGFEVNEFVANDKVKKLVFCSGKVYYDIMNKRMEGDIKDVAISTVEQLFPFPYDQIMEEMKKYPNAEIAWVQEEPKNMGPYTYMRPRFETALREINDNRRVSYVGRKSNCSPATGFPQVHKAEVAQLVVDTFATS